MAKPDVLEVLRDYCSQHGGPDDFGKAIGMLSELIAATDALRFDMYELTDPALVEAFGAKKIMVLDISTWDRFEAANKACRGM